MASGVDAFDHVDSEMTRRTRATLAIVMPRIEDLGSMSQCGEPVLGIDHLADIGRAGQVLTGDTPVPNASTLTVTVRSRSLQPPPGEGRDAEKPVGHEPEADSGDHQHAP